MLSGAGAVAGGIGLSSIHPQLGLANPYLANSTSTATRDYATRETYDWLVDSLVPVMSIPNRSTADEHGFWTWTQSSVMRTYPWAYRRWGDTRYLDALITDADLMLSERDSVRGVTDWRGLSLPAWRHASNWTAGSGDVPGTNGAPLLRLRIGQTGPSNGTRGSFTITAGTSPDTFTLVATGSSGTVDTFANLTMDPASPDYVVTRLYWDEPNANRMTALDLRADPTISGQPALGDYLLTADFTYGFVDTAVMVQALAEYSSLVLPNRRLARKPIARQRVSYGDKAEEYVAAVKAALAIHDDNWRENSSGEGWYVIPAEHPSPWAGSDVPHNQNLAMATAFMHLADATSDSAYQDRVSALLRRFKNDLILGSDGAHGWYYNHREGLFFNGWTREDHVSNRIPYSPGYRAKEDTSHATLDIAAAATAAQKGLVFTATDMQHLAATFNVRLVETDASGNILTLNSNVFGDGGNTTYDNRAGLWAVLTPWSQQVFNYARALYNTKQYPVARGSVAESTGVLATIADE